MKTETGNTLVVGIGSPRGDDQAGWLIADRLAADCELANVVVKRAASPVHLLDWLDRVERLVICDACHGLGRVGEVAHWQWPDGEFLNMAWSGTHDLSLPTVLQLAERLGRLPPSVVVWAIEAATDVSTTTISAAVEAALPDWIEAVANHLHQETTCTNGPW